MDIVLPNEQKTISLRRKRSSHWLQTSVASGVPQGSILGPLLFGLFIRDLPKVLKHFSCRIYADDTPIYHLFRAADIHAAIVRVQPDAQAVADWATAIGLELNEKKTKVMLMGSVPHKAPIDMNSLPPVVINGTNIKYVDRVKCKRDSCSVITIPSFTVTVQPKAITKSPAYKKTPTRLDI